MARRPMIRGSLALALLVGCAAPQKAPPKKLYAGDAAAPPSMEALPDPDVSVDRMTERMRFAWILSQQAFELEDPSMPPVNASMPELRRWTTEELEPWLAKKNQLVEAARKELNLAAEESHRQRILAGALVGLMYEDMARVLLAVPMPKELESDSEIRRIYEEVVRFQASPYLQHARRAYRACSANATHPETMHHWSSYCVARLEELPVDEHLEHGETVVTVTVDE